MSRGAGRPEPAVACKVLATIQSMRNVRPVSWIKAARKAFEPFPEDGQSDMRDALTLDAEGRIPASRSRSRASRAAPSRLRCAIAGTLFVRSTP